MNVIDVLVKDIKEPHYKEKLLAFIELVLEKLGKNNWELSLLLCKNDYIQELNKQYRNKEYPTDVLSFSQIEDDGERTSPYPDNNKNGMCHAGDIVISLDKLQKNAEQYNVDVETEFKRLIIHGILHLNGMDHDEEDPYNPERKTEMINLQEKLLGTFTEEHIF